MKPIWTAMIWITINLYSGKRWGQSSFTVGTMKTRIFGEQQELVKQIPVQNSQHSPQDMNALHADNGGGFEDEAGFVLSFTNLFIDSSNESNILYLRSCTYIYYIMCVFICLCICLFHELDLLSIILRIPSVRWWKSMDCLCINLRISRFTSWSFDELWMLNVPAANSNLPIWNLMVMELWRMYLFMYTYISIICNMQYTNIQYRYIYIYTEHTYLYLCVPSSLVWKLNLEALEAWVFSNFLPLLPRYRHFISAFRCLSLASVINKACLERFIYISMQTFESTSDQEIFVVHGGLTRVWNSEGW